MPGARVVQKGWLKVPTCSCVLYPFEPDFYLGLPVKAEFVGHPLADEISPGVG